MKKRDRIISKVKSKYWNCNHKYVARISKSVKESISLEKSNGNTRWWQEIVQEMKNVRINLEFYKGNLEDLHTGYQEVSCQIIFDVNMGNKFRRKSQMVAGRNKNTTLYSLTSLSVVSRDSVRIALTISALKNLKLLECDNHNAYLNANFWDKIWTMAGPEFGPEQVKVVLVVRSMYVMKSS